MKYGLSYKAFDEIAWNYDEWFETEGRDFYRLELEALRKVVPDDLSNPLILDVGAGTGRFSHIVRGSVVATDPSLSMLKIACKKGIESVCAVCEALPFKDESFDVVICVTVICFVLDKKKCVSEIRRVSKERGVLIIGFINRDSWLGALYTEKKEKGHPVYKHAEFLSLDEVTALLEECGFKLHKTAATLFLSESGFSLRVSSKPEREAGFIALSAFSE